MGMVLKYIFYIALLVVVSWVGFTAYEAWNAEKNAPEVVGVVEVQEETMGQQQ